MAPLYKLLSASNGIIVPVGKPIELPAAVACRFVAPFMPSRTRSSKMRSPPAGRVQLRLFDVKEMF